MRTEKERVLREAFEIACEIGYRGFMTKWMIDREAMREWPDPAVRERELRAFWGEQWKESYPALVKNAEALSLTELTAYRSHMEAQLVGTNDFGELFEHYAALGAEKRARGINQKEEP